MKLHRQFMVPYSANFFWPILFICMVQSSCQAPDIDARDIETPEITEASNALWEQFRLDSIKTDEAFHRDSCIGSSYRSEPFGDALIRACKTGDLSQVKKLVDATRPCLEKGVFRWPVGPDLIRSLFADYQENIFDISYSTPITGDSNVHLVTYYKVYALSNGNQLLYTKVVQVNTGTFGTFKALMLEQNNATELQDFFKQYAAIFHMPVGINSFFEDEVVYGAHCGFAGINPSEREQLEEAVKAKNINFLNDWLGQPCLEKQVYAYEGLYQLIQKGYVLTPTQMQVMQAVRGRKGTINTCGGCMFWTKGVEEVWTELDNSLNRKSEIGQKHKA